MEMHSRCFIIVAALVIAGAPLFNTAATAQSHHIANDSKGNIYIAQPSRGMRG